MQYIVCVKCYMYCGVQRRGIIVVWLSYCMWPNPFFNFMFAVLWHILDWEFSFCHSDICPKAHQLWWQQLWDASKSCHARLGKSSSQPPLWNENCLHKEMKSMQLNYLYHSIKQFSFNCRMKMLREKCHQWDFTNTPDIQTEWPPTRVLKPKTFSFREAI